MKRSTGELYDAIVDSLMPTVATVGEPVLRQVLVTMARFTNPNRDQFFGPERTWRCYASASTLAELSGCSLRQVMRALQGLRDQGYIDAEATSRGPGRPREGESAGPGRGVTYCLRPDRWIVRPAKTYDAGGRHLETYDTGGRPFSDFKKGLPNRTETYDTGGIPFAETSAKSDVPSAETYATGVIQTPTVVNPGVRLNPGENPRAPAGAREGETGVFSLNGHENGHTPLPQPALSGMLTEVPKANLCRKCWARENEPAQPECANPGWHIPAVASSA